MANEEEAEQIDGERRYLESLLKDRFNFYMVFSSFAFAGIVSSSDELPFKEQAVWVVIVISFLFLLAVVRTICLINHILKQLEALDKEHPYVKAKNACTFFNANYAMGAIAFCVLVLFIVVATGF